jgi:hypothetical protein
MPSLHHLFHDQRRPTLNTLLLPQSGLLGEAGGGRLVKATLVLPKAADMDVITRQTALANLDSYAAA